MALVRFKNMAFCTLAVGVGPTDLTLSLEATKGALFPSPTGGDYFFAALEADNGDFEIVKCTARTGDSLTVVRGQDGTTAMTFDAGAVVEMRICAAALERFLQLGGGTMDGPLDMGGNLLVATNIRGAAGIGTNELAIPANGDPPTIGGSPILTAASGQIPSGVIVLWSGTAANIPTGWLLCNGSNGTPDLRDRFVVGAGSTYTPGVTGGAVSGTTSSNGAHSHSGNTGAHALTIAQMPEHTHTYDTAPNASGSSNTAIEGASGGIQSGDGTAINETGGGEAHSHTIGSDGAHTHTVATLPPYYALCYIMKQ
jgi:hypothetical protein